MKKYLLAVLLLASFQSFGQFLNYTNINGRYKWIAGKFDSTFTIPVGTTPSLRTGGGNAPGALFYSTTDSTVYQYSGTQWTRLRGSDTAHVISAYVRNTTASPMTPGQVVYINGSTGTTPTIALANNKQDSTSAMTFGFVRGNIPVNGFGYITTFGPLEGVNTNAYTEGEVIYLDSIPGQFTHDKPQAPYHMVTLGYIIKKSGGNGTIYAKIQNGYELDELHNVRITEPVLNKSVIIYDSVRRLWVDTTVSAAGLGLGGSGTTNYVSKWTSSTALGNSLVYDNGTSVIVGATSSPIGNKFEIVDGSSTSTMAIRGSGGIYGLSLFDNSTLSGIGTTDNKYIYFFTNNTSRMRLTANGRLLIGTTTESTYELDLVGDIRSTLDANINGLTVGKGGGSVASNTVVGANAGMAITTAGSNTLIGYLAGRSIIDQGANTFIGFQSGQALNSGYYNTAIGTNSLKLATSGYSNVAIGFQSAEVLTSGIENVFVGMYSADNLTTGSRNTIVGYQTGRGITTGNYNTIIGAGVTGLSASLSNTIILADGQGNQRLRIDNTGNVGIGTTSPLAISNYTGQTLSGTTGSYITFYQTTTRVGTLEINSTNNFKLKTNGTVPITLETNSIERARIDGSTGNVLIGTTTDAGYKLDVNGTARVSGNFTISGPAGSVTNVDIFGGTTGGSGQTLRIYGSTPTTQGLFLTYTTATAESFIDAGYHTTSSGASFGDIIFRSKKNATNTLAENMRIRGFDGNVLIGTSTNDASAIVNISSTTKGFLPPRMTNAQMVAIATPAAGLVVYDTTNNKLNVYDGTNWVAVH